MSFDLSDTIMELVNRQDYLNTMTLACPTWELRYSDTNELYLRRFVLAGLDCLENHDETCKYHVFLHEIMMPDGDRAPHNHPWRQSTTLILSGGYEEIRPKWDNTYTTMRDVLYCHREGDISNFQAFDYHRITRVLPGTKTLFIASAEEARGWGFLVDGKHVDHKEYFAAGQNKMQTVRVR